MSEKNFKKYLNVYEFESELPGTGEVVKFKPLTTNQMKNLLQYENETDILKISEALDMLIESAVINEDFNIDNLYLRDRFKLLIDIRKKTKGEHYQFQFKCPQCNSQNLNNVDLDQLNVKKKENEAGKVTLNEEVSLEVEHITRKDEKEAMSSIQITENMTESEIEMEHWINALASSIRAIDTPEGRDEDLTFEDKKFIIGNTNNSVEKIGE